MKRLDLMSPEELAELREHFNGLGLDMTLERYVELKSELTDKEMLLAQEYDALGDDPARRDAIREALHNLRCKLNAANERMYYATGKGKEVCHIDYMRDIEIGKMRSLSDNGISIDRMMDEIDRVFENRRKRYNALRKRLVRNKAKHTVTTLRLITANGSNRARSIRMLALANGTSLAAAKAKYWADLHTIEQFVGITE